VELGLYRVPGTPDLLVIPNTLAQTRLIERGIVRIDAGTQQVTVHPVPQTPGHSPGNISSEQFYEAMAKRNPLLPERIRSFIAELEEIDARPEFLRSLNIKWEGPSRTYNLGIIQRDGQVWTDTAGATPPLDLSHRYIEELAAAIGGGVERSKLGGKWYVTIDGKPPRIEQIMDRLDAWARVAKEHANRIRLHAEEPAC
jgi:hypothetical protein